MCGVDLKYPKFSVSQDSEFMDLILSGRANTNFRQNLKNYMKIKFYNNWHNGDIHNSRSFLREIVKSLPNHEFSYLHFNSKRLLRDIPQIKYEDIRDYDFLNTKDRFKISQPLGDGTNSPILIDEDCCFINTWVGSNPQSDNIFKRHITAYKRIFKILGLKFDENKNWCPEIDFSFYKTKKIEEFINKKNKFRILVCNGFSLQAKDFSFKNALNKIIDYFNTEIEVILTSKQDELDGVIYTDDITERPFDDLNEISLISTSADMIIGRSSGPSSYCIVKENQLNENKTFINFINIDDDEKFDLSKLEEPKRGPFFLKHSKAKFIFTNNFSDDAIFNTIKENLIARNIDRVFVSS